MTTHAIATVCLSGTLEDKLDAAAAAGFDGVELFEPDLVASPLPPAEVRARCTDLGLSIDLYQPFRDLDSTDPERFAANLRRAERKFDVMAGLGTDTVLVCSSVGADAVADPDLIAEQLHALAERAHARGLRIAYEALAWGTHVDTYDGSWDVVRRADHPSLGLCLDSFHVLSRGSDPAGIRAIPAAKLFFLQLADAPRLRMDVLQWSRHHRLFPGQGAFDLPAFVEHVLGAGYPGPLSLEVFNDVYRQSDPRRTATDAMRSLLALREQLVRRAAPPDGTVAVRPPAPPALTGHAFTEIAADDAGAARIAGALEALGFVRSGRHRSKPVELFEQGGARVLLNTGPPAAGSEIAALGLESADPPRSAARAAALHAPLLPRRRGPAEADLAAVAAPDGTSVFFCRTDSPDGWRTDFVAAPGAGGTGAGGTGAGFVHGIDHVALAQPYDQFDEAALFYRAVLGMEPEPTAEIAAPFGVVRDRVVTAGGVRLVLTASLLRRGGWAPGVPDPQYIAFGTTDALGTARAARAAGAPLLDIGDNYYDDLDARYALDPDLLAELRELGVMYDRDAGGEYRHFATELLGGRVFLQVVQRSPGYDGHAATDAPVRMAAQRRRRLAGAGGGGQRTSAGRFGSNAQSSTR
ncbi:sugar phosphate isomerase/epimerase and 4-hydroxyphenylpyruvate domain-containing protein [Pseudonocardia humida]|uniref:3-dehydroshikimate dehydratase n=1 Tax=Pseudonocardia humida TaxID=2800819 RepID=A0ABT0ZSW3_9PSEU|nr:sugar phosphate isomerase/epimerase and 4-hydroxyphenylpyruvate domain-containing protein [Pseudonocardia humida]MCO1653780.1 sugar phosphate isomerase/epimerase and 4-hydroxyphenylpyruvate domain-containing protein [Pseudonocardia humida]